MLVGKQSLGNRKDIEQLKDVPNFPPIWDVSLIIV